MLAALVERQQAPTPRRVEPALAVARRVARRDRGAPTGRRRRSVASSSTCTARPSCRRWPPSSGTKSATSKDARAKSCGQPAPGVDLGIVGVDGAPVPAGDVGEVVVRGPNVMAGYWNKPEQTAAAMLDGGWYRTGDLGSLDADGYLYLVDRAKDMIVSGGENVYCTEVEDALYTHPAVLEATVFGIPDDAWGEAVHAVVVPREESTALTEQVLTDHCRGLIAGYKVPKSHHVPVRAAAQVGTRQGAEADAASAVLGGPRAPDQLTCSPRSWWTWARWPSRSKIMMSSAGPSMAAKACGVMVANSAASPVSTMISRSPSSSRTRPSMTKNQS